MCWLCSWCQYLFNTSCVALCHSNYEPNDSSICGFCQVNNKYNLNGACVTNCGTGMTPNAQGLCKTCSAAGLLSFSGNCVLACSANFYPVSSICTSMVGKFILNGTLVNSCPRGYSSDDANQTCRLCKDLNQ